MKRVPRTRNEINPHAQILEIHSVNEIRTLANEMPSGIGICFISSATKGAHFKIAKQSFQARKRISSIKRKSWGNPTFLNAKCKMQNAKFGKIAEFIDIL